MTSHIHNAAKQLNSFNSDKNIYNVIALYNEDKLCGIDDIRAVLTGNFISKDGESSPIYKKFSDGRLKNDIKNIALFIWLSEGKKPQFIFNFEQGVERVNELCNLFGVDPKKIIPS